MKKYREIRKIIVLGLYVAISGCLNLGAMQSNGDLKRSFQGEMNALKKQKQENHEIKIDTTGIPESPTWQEVARALERGELTSAFLEAYVRRRIDMRIAYWKKLYEEWKQGNTSVNLEEIPIYVRLNSNPTSYDLVDKVFVVSDIEALNSHVRIFSRDNFKNRIKTTHGWFTSHNKSLYVNDNDVDSEDSYDVFAYRLFETVEHEMTHAEQLYNGVIIRRLLHDVPSKLFISLTNKDAAAYYNCRETSNAVQFIKGSDDSSLEEEADHAMIRFYPNLYCWKGMSYLIRGTIDDEEESTDDEEEAMHREAGYLTHKECIELMEKYLKEQNHNIIEYMEHKPEDICIKALGNKRIAEKLKKLGLNLKFN